MFLQFLSVRLFVASNLKIDFILFLCNNIVSHTKTNTNIIINYPISFIFANQKSLNKKPTRKPSNRSIKFYYSPKKILYHPNNIHKAKTIIAVNLLINIR